MTDEPDPFDQQLADEKARQERRAERQARFLARKETDDDARAWQADREAEKKCDADTDYLRYFREQTAEAGEQRNAGEKALAAKKLVSYTQAILIAQHALFGKGFIGAPSPQEEVVINVGRNHCDWQHYWTRSVERDEQIAVAERLVAPLIEWHGSGRHVDLARLQCLLEMERERRPSASAVEPPAVVETAEPNSPDEATAPTEVKQTGIVARLAEWIFAQHPRDDGEPMTRNELMAGARQAKFRFSTETFSDAYGDVYESQAKRPLKGGWPLKEPYRSSLARSKSE